MILTIAEHFIGFAGFSELEVGLTDLLRLLSLGVVGQSEHAEPLGDVGVRGVLWDAQDLIVVLSHFIFYSFLILKLLYFKY